MRIVSLSPSSTEILFAIGAGADVVGVTHFCDYPAEALRRERLGEWLHTNPAAIGVLEPDLIVTTTVFPDELRHYAGAGEVLHLEPTSLGGVLETILQLGRAVGRTQAAEQLIQMMQWELENIRSLAPARKLRVYCEAWPNPPTQTGNWLPELIEIAGGKAVGGLNNQKSAPVDVDALHAADPDLLVFHWCEPQPRFDAEQIRNRPGWSGLRALQANALEFLPTNLLNRPGPRLVDGARQLQAALARHQHVS